METHAINIVLRVLDRINEVQAKEIHTHILRNIYFRIYYPPGWARNSVDDRPKLEERDRLHRPKQYSHPLVVA